MELDEKDGENNKVSKKGTINCPFLIIFFETLL
jgi:hypothetical protein